MVSTMEQLHPLVPQLADLLGIEGNDYATMNEAGSPTKYTKAVHNRKPRPLSLDRVQGHLRGDCTIAVRLIASDNTAKAAVLDIDDGGEAALLRVLDEAQIAGLTAFAQTSHNPDHNHDG